MRPDDQTLYLVINPLYGIADKSFLPELFPRSTNCMKCSLLSHCMLEVNSSRRSPLLYKSNWFLIFPVQSVYGSWI